MLRMALPPQPSPPPVFKPRPLVRSLTLDDLTHDLVWPKLLRVPHFCMRPQRVVMALVYLIGMMLLGIAGDRVDGNPTANELGGMVQRIALSGASAVASSTGDAPGARLAKQIHDAFVGEPALLLKDAPIVALVILPLMVIWTALFAGAISRSAACEIGQGVHLSWPQSLGFAIRRLPALVLALVLPVLIVWAIVLALSVGGWALFSANILNILGGVLWPLFLVGGLVAAVIMVTYLLGWSMLIPSVACEGTDAIDAVQHAYSFVFARPLRLAMYLVILVAQLAFFWAIVAAVLWLAVHVAQTAAVAWTLPRGTQALGGIPLHAPIEPPFGTPQPSTATRVSRGLVNFWSLVPAALLLAFPISYLWTGATMLYLAMRRLVDAQDFGEIWMPTLIPGTLAATPVATASASQAVSETGPADNT